MPNRPEIFTLDAKTRKRYSNRARPKTASRGYGWKWQCAARAFLRRHPLCRDHQLRGEVVAACVVDHVTPHRGNSKLFWDRSNWQPLCKSCHDRKTGMGG